MGLTTRLPPRVAVPSFPSRLQEEEDDEPQYEEIETKSWELVNENKPIWTRKPEDVEEDQYKEFYKALTKEPEAPLYFTHFAAEGEVEFKSILYIPGKAPFNLFDHQQMTLMTNIRLYVRRVFITDEFKDLLPRYDSPVEPTVAELSCLCQACQD